MYNRLHIVFSPDHYINLSKCKASPALHFHKFLKISGNGKGVKNTFEKNKNLEPYRAVFET